MQGDCPGQPLSQCSRIQKFFFKVLFFSTCKALVDDASFVLTRVYESMSTQADDASGQPDVVNVSKRRDVDKV